MAQCAFSHSSERTESALLREMLTLKRDNQRSRRGCSFLRNGHYPSEASLTVWLRGRVPRKGAGSRRPPGFSSRSGTIALSQG